MSACKVCSSTEHRYHRKPPALPSKPSKRLLQITSSSADVAFTREEILRARGYLSPSTATSSVAGPSNNIMITEHDVEVAVRYLSTGASS